MILFLSWSPNQAAEYLDDKEVGRQLKEILDIFSTLAMTDWEPYDSISNWIMETEYNYQWIIDYMYCLNRQYYERHNELYPIKIDSNSFIKKPNDIKVMTALPEAFPDHFKISNDQVINYRFYYMMTKNPKTWTNKKPFWMEYLPEDNGQQCERNIA